MVTIAIERQDYGPASNRQTRELAGFVFLGFVGAALAGRGSDAYVSTLQLRCTDPIAGSILIQQAAVGSVHEVSREQLDGRTADAALMSLLYQLAEAHARREGTPFPTVTREVHDEIERARAIEQWQSECSEPVPER